MQGHSSEVNCARDCRMSLKKTFALALCEADAENVCGG